VAAYDAFPEARAGWIDAVEAEEREPAPFTVRLTDLAAEQASWLRETWQVDFTARLTELLSRAPVPHRTRRIRRREGAMLEIGCGAWCAVFAVEGEVVSVTALESAYKLTFLTRPDYQNVPDREAQLAFRTRWPVRADAAPDGSCR
jgi:hypothetical protein